MISFLPAAISAGRVLIQGGDTPHTGATIIGGQAYGAARIYGTATAADPTDTFIGGAAYTSDGILRTYDATASVPAFSTVCGGIAITNTGQMCLTTGLVTSAATYYGGLAVRLDGAVYATVIAP